MRTQVHIFKNRDKKNTIGIIMTNPLSAFTELLALWAEVYPTKEFDINRVEFLCESQDSLIWAIKEE